MESTSLLLIIVGAAIIAVVLLARLALWRRGGEEQQIMPRLEPEIDPLFAEIDQTAAPSSSRPLSMADATEAIEPTAIEGEGSAAAESPPSHRRPPRVAEDPRRVVVLNVVAGEQDFAGEAVRAALADAGLEFGEWQIFHYYAPGRDEPPLFSLANMVKPGSFDPDRMDALPIPGLSLFLVPAGDDGDIPAFDAMLMTARRLAERLEGEVRDARRSVLTRQAIGLIREQLNEWRCKTQVAQH
jgi:cell division protein ZipA